jgi:hypothetical protein
MPKLSSSRGDRSTAMPMWSTQRSMYTGTFRLRQSVVAVDRQRNEAMSFCMTHRVTDLRDKRRRDCGLECEAPTDEHSGTVRKGLNEPAGHRDHRADEETPSSTEAVRDP